jgi:putative FmdB family regulatory protein
MLPQWPFRSSDALRGGCVSAKICYRTAPDHLQTITMPTYEYECQSCGQHFDVFQRMSDAKLETCLNENCGGPVRRLLGTGAGVIFKGSGFYQTDYRTSSYQSGAKKDSSPAAASCGSSKPCGDCPIPAAKSD